MAIEYVDSTQLDAGLTSVADAIRAKSGGSSQLAFPAGFVSEIQAIPSGGGLPPGVSAVATGTVTVTSAVNGLTFTHGLGVIPRAFVVYVTNTWLPVYNPYTLYAAVFTTDGTSVRSNIREQTTNNALLNIGRNRNNSGDVGTNTVTIWRTSNVQGQFQPTQYTDSGKTTTEALEYRWYAIA